jgi:hypothetical protein
MQLEFPYFSHLTFFEEVGLTIDEFRDSLRPDVVKMRSVVVAPSVPITPDMNSGVTIGVGYDMSVSARNREVIFSDLTQANVPAEIARGLSEGERIKGWVAKTWCDQHQDLKLSIDNVIDLYKNVYLKGYVETAAQLVKSWQGNWETYPPIVQEVLVDLHYRGDLNTPYGREKLQPPVKANDLIGIRDAICDVEYWQERGNLPRTEKDHSPNRRFIARRDWVLKQASSAISFPLALKKEQAAVDSVTAYYHHTETDQAGGFFPLGLYTNLHSGIHVECDDSMGKGLVPVCCLAPGYIVAVRLSSATPKGIEEPKASADARKRGAERNRVSAWAAGNHNGFILVRHEIAQQDKDPNPIVLYSLYFHLVPPDWENAGSKIPVPWIERVGRSYGTFQVIDPGFPKEFSKLRWTAKLEGDPGAPKILVQGKVALFGDTLGKLEKEHAYGRPSPDPGVASAVWKPPAQDLVAIHDALLEGKVVTFHKPYLKVGQGEVLGFADPVSDMGRGFIHWELLTPNQNSGVERLLALAQSQKLGIPAAVFEKFEETGDPDNYFQDSELARLVEVVNKPIPQAARMTSHNAPDLLKEFKQNPDKVPFAKFDVPPRSLSGHVFPFTLKLESAKRAKPASGSATVRLRYAASSFGSQQELPVQFDSAGKAEVKAFLPADVERLTIEPIGFHLQPGPPLPVADERADNVAHFQRVAVTRWRNVWIRHLNEWSSKGMEKSFKKRQNVLEWFPPGTHGDLAKLAANDQLEKAVQALSWWASPDCVPAPIGGAPDKLFGANKMLPEQCLLDNLHPVTGAWLLNLLHKHQLMHFQVPDPAPVSPGKAFCFGWMPARAPQPPRAVGEACSAVVVEEGVHDGGNLNLVLKNGRHELNVGAGEYTRGLFHQGIPMGFWGDWTLRVDKESPKVLGDATVHVLKPVLQAENGMEPPYRVGPRLEWRVAFSRNCPAEIKGLVTLKTSRHAAAAQAGTFQTAPLAIAVVGRWSKDTGGIRFLNGFLERGPANIDVPLKKTSTMRDFHAASSLSRAAYRAEKVPRVAEALVEAVDSVSARAGKVALRELRDTGLSVTLSGVPVATLQKAVEDHNASAPAHLKITAQVAAGQPQGLSVTVPSPAPSTDLPGGECIFQFNPAGAFSKLATGLGKDEVLDVKLGMLFPNGAQFLAPWKGVEPLGEGYVEKSVVDNLRNAAPDCIEGWCDVPATTLLGVPRFGVPRFTIEESYLVVTVDLIGGEVGFWSAAAPQLFNGAVNLGGNIIARSQTLVMKRKLSDLKIKDHIHVQARSTKRGIPFRGQSVNVVDSDAILYENREKLLEFTHDSNRAFGRVTFTARFQATPTDKVFAIKVFANGRGLEVPLRYGKSTVLGRTVFGECDQEGFLVATCDVESIIHSSPGVATFSAKLFESPAPHRADGLIERADQPFAVFTPSSPQ